MGDFEGTVALVTGSSRGIGQAVARLLAARGAHVVVNYRTDEAGAAETVASIEAAGGRATACRADVGRIEDLERLAAAAEALGPVSVLVNNAGAVNRKLVLDLSLEEFDEVLNTNLRGVFYLSRLVARGMAERRAGSIVNVSSILSQQTIPGRSAYAASKGGLESLTKAMALDLAAYNVRVNTVAPGLVRTEMLLGKMPETVAAELERYIPFKRYGEPDELAEAIVFLASPAASYITGALLPVDGGLRVLEAGPR